MPVSMILRRVGFSLLVTALMLFLQTKDLSAFARRALTVSRIVAVHAAKALDGLAAELEPKEDETK